MAYALLLYALSPFSNGRMPYAPTDYVCLAPRFRCALLCNGVAVINGVGGLIKTHADFPAQHARDELFLDI